MPPISFTPVRSAIEANSKFADDARPVETKTYRQRLISINRKSHTSVKSLLKAAGRKFTALFRGKRQEVFVAVAASTGRPHVATEPETRINVIPHVLTVDAEVYAPPTPSNASLEPSATAESTATESDELSNALDALRQKIAKPLQVSHLDRFRVGTTYRNTAGRKIVNGGGLRNIYIEPRSAAAARARALALGDIPARPLEQAVADWYPATQEAEITKIWRAHAEEYPREAKEFSKFLDKLRGNVSAKSPVFRADVALWLWQVSDSKELRKETLFSADLTSSSCHDRIGSAFNEMKGHLLAEEIRQGLFDGKTAGDTAALALKLRHCFRRLHLQKIGVKKTQMLVEEFKKKLGPDRLAQLGNDTAEIEAVLREDFVDEIQIDFALQMKLRQALSLDVGGLEMQYKSNLKEDDLAEALKSVMEEENAEFHDWFANSHQWDAVLQRRFPEKHAAFVKARTAGLNKALKTIEADVTAEIIARGMTDLIDDHETRSGIRKGITDKVSEDLKGSLTREILALDKCPEILHPVW